MVRGGSGGKVDLDHSIAATDVCRDDRIRTCDPPLPKRMRYQAALHPAVTTRSYGHAMPALYWVGDQVTGRQHLDLMSAAP